MSAPEAIAVDQALFGYSDGHRQIAASVRLPSKDQYQLAAATDLASGTNLSADESYLTGLPLAESRRFALIRTWAALEMPRPGCVWSHVLLIDQRLLASHGDLSDFLPLLKRPTGDEQAYGEPLEMLASARPAVVADLDVITSLVRQYYSGERVLLDPNVPPSAVEAAIMAVWSQQWPRLRSSFSFRTASGGDRRRSELIAYDVQVGSRKDYLISQDEDNWIIVGSEDAASRKVTPLRRLLWRYGRDLSSPRRHYRTLVELYLAVANSNELSAKEAIRIFESIPDNGDGEILKRDILGVGSTSPSLFPPLSPDELLRLLVSSSLNGLSTEEELRRRFDSIPSSQVPVLADFVERHGGELGRWAEAIDAGLIAAADRNTLLEPLPGRIRRLVLTARPELIDSDTVASLSDEALVDLTTAHATDGAAAVLASAVVRRDLGSANERLFRAMPIEVFRAATEAVRSKELNSSWFRTVSSNAEMIFRTEWPAGIRSSADIAAGLALLRFPKEANRTSEFWTGLLANAKDDVLGEDRIRLQAFLLRAALQNPSQATWKVAALVLPELRPSVLRGELPSDVNYMLGGDLPRFNSVAYWDIDKRILMSLSYLRQRFPDDKVLRTLKLSEKEMDTVLHGAEEESEWGKNRSWRWF